MRTDDWKMLVVLGLLVLLYLWIAVIPAKAEPPTEGCVVTPGQQIAQEPQNIASDTLKADVGPSDQTILTVDDVAAILSGATKDIMAQGYEPLFLGDNVGIIWCRDKTGNVQPYPLKPLIDRRLEAKAKVEKNGK